MHTPDADLHTLHLRCGSDIQGTLAEAGFVGDFAEFADPFSVGPVRDLPESGLIAERGDFIADAFRIDPALVADKQRTGYGSLQRLDDYERVVLWFEHDSYDQLILAYLLMRIGRARPRPRVELIAVDRFPGIDRFIGIGQLDPTQLAALWPQRREVSADQYALGAAAWHALTAPDPIALHALAETGTPALPMMTGALRRHLQELPDLRTGLSLTERLTLEIARDLGPIRIGRAFGELMRQREPLPWLGDIMFEWIVRRLTAGNRPLLHRTPAPDPLRLDRWAMRDEIALTGWGRDVLVGQVHHLDLALLPRRVGGITIPGAHGTWCWDAGNARPTFRA